MTEQRRNDADHARTARVKDGLDGARDAAKQAAARTSAELDRNPLALLVGGVAVGALAGALIPRSAREKALLRPVGARLGAVAGAALVAAKEAGRAELDARGLTPDGAKEKARGFFKDVGKAATTAGSAAAQSARAEASGDAQAKPPADGHRTAGPNAAA
jgi:F0F1-type ATP synthase assembly protein I